MDKGWITKARRKRDAKGLTGPASARAFTLIELLVVILIIGILIAVAAPSFLGQTQKAHDSEAKQYLTVAYKAAKASTVTEQNQGDYVLANVIAAIEAEGSGLSATSGSCPNGVTSTDPQDIVVDSAFTGGSNLKLCNDPELRVWTLTVTNHGPPVISGPVILNSEASPPPPPPAPPAPPPPPPAPATNSAPPALSGTARQDQKLTVSNGSWSGNPASFTYSYQFQRCSPACVNITSTDATNDNEYTLVDADVGNTVRAVVTATNGVAPAGTANSGDSATVAASYRGAVLRDNPVGYWRLDDASGPALDSSGNGRNGTYLNGVGRAVSGALTTDPNPAADFDGVDDQVDIPDAAALRFTNSFSFEAWVEVDATSQETILSKGNNGNDPDMIWQLSYPAADQIGFWDKGGSIWRGSSSGLSFSPGWKHVVVTYDGSTVRFYLNGVAVGTTFLVNGTLATSTDPLRIGVQGTAPNVFHRLNGRIDEVAVYGTVLTPARILAHYNAR